jgi:hypothetical protein
MQNKEIKVYRSNNELYKIENYKDKTDFELIFNKIKIDAYADQDEEFCQTYFLGNFDKEQKVIYAYLSSDSQLTFVDNLNKFSENYRTEKDWKIKKFTEI